MNKKTKVVKVKKTYTIVDFPEEGVNTGSYIGSTASQAAQKAIKRLTSESNISGKDGAFIKFWLRDVNATNNNSNDLCFIGTRVELYKPKNITKDGINITSHYKYIVIRYNKNFILSNKQ
jgi:hypothetical protein